MKTQDELTGEKLCCEIRRAYDECVADHANNPKRRQYLSDMVTCRESNPTKRYGATQEHTARSRTRPHKCERLYCLEPRFPNITDRHDHDHISAIAS